MGGAGLDRSLAGCTSVSHGAAVMCEQFAQDRVGTELTFWGVEQYRTVGQAPQWTVHHGFVEPASGAQTEFLCTVVEEGDSWRLVDLTTNLLTTPEQWAQTVTSAGFTEQW